MIKVLFVCVHNAARSQMAETYLNILGKGYFQAESAGLEPGVLNPDVVKVMAEEGIDIHDNPTKSVFDFYKVGKRYHYVIKVCDSINGQKCPIFPSTLETLEWNHEDPASFIGDEEERLIEARRIRDEIKHNVQAFVDEHILNELNAQAENLRWENTMDPVGYQLSSQDRLEGIRASRVWLSQDVVSSQAAWMEALVNLLVLEFGTSMLSQLDQVDFTDKQVLGWMRSMIKQAGLRSTQAMDVRQFESILHAQYDKHQSHVRVMTYSLNNMLNPQVLVDVLMKAIQNQRIVLWLGKEDAGVLLGVEGDEQGPETLKVLHNGTIESKSINDWLSLSNDNDSLMIVERK